jgi:hypothetical protein
VARQRLTQGGLVDLDGRAAAGFEVGDLVT